MDETTQPTEAAPPTSPPVAADSHSSGEAVPGDDDNPVLLDGRTPPAGAARADDVDRGKVAVVEDVDSSVAKAEKPPVDSTVSSPSPKPVDSTVAKRKSNVVNISEQRKKRRLDSTVAKRRKTGVKSGETVDKPKAIKGHEWRRQGTGWTLLRSWYETLPDGKRKRVREYVQHYSATALKAAESLRRVTL